MNDPRIFFGVGGVAPHDTPAAHHWANRLRWPMTAIALLALPALWLDLAPPDAGWHHVGLMLDALILLAFSAELLWMMHLSRQPFHYAARNWLDLVIIVAAAASLFGIEEQWVALTRVMRVVWASLLLARTLAMARELFRSTATLWILAAGAILLALSGAVFYWLEPTVHSYGEGLWLAFVTGTTIGYGDFVPTTTAARIFAIFIVIIGFGMLSLTTASIAAFLIGEDEARLRHEMHRDIRELRGEVSALREEIHQLRLPPRE
ncbi:MAG: ion channel [Rugosibacter sp.]|nr:ion channel [Rugosibacter sp.]